MAGKGGAVRQSDFDIGSVSSIPVDAKFLNRLARKFRALDEVVLHEVNPQPR
jgi:hypothetical protein